MGMGVQCRLKLGSAHSSRRDGPGPGLNARAPAKRYLRITQLATPDASQEEQASQRRLNIAIAAVLSRLSYIGYLPARRALDRQQRTCRFVSCRFFLFVRAALVKLDAHCFLKTAPLPISQLRQAKLATAGMLSSGGFSTLISCWARRASPLETGNVLLTSGAARACARN